MAVLVYNQQKNIKTEIKGINPWKSASNEVAHLNSGFLLFCVDSYCSVTNCTRVVSTAVI